jgi:hypothetical protein
MSMSTDDGGHRDAAIDALAGREYNRAGDEYTRAAWRVLADPREGVGTFDPGDNGWVGVGLGYLVAGAASYRVAGASARATRRGVEGVAVANDLAGQTGPVQAACFHEFVADFRAVAGLDGVESAYETASNAYERAADAIEEPQTRGTTPLFEAAASPLKQLARGQDNGEIAITWSDLHGADPDQPGRFLAHRAEYKRQRMPALVEQTVADGYLAAPRGSTAYDTDAYRCPNCGSNDVNWTGASTVCLRCSRPVEEL